MPRVAMPSRRNYLVTFGRLLLEETDECVLWPGSCSHGGYGRLGQAFVHVLALTIRSGQAADGRDAMHLCHTPPCMNYRHLAWGTRSENERMKGPRTHCRRGHELTEGNVRREGTR